MEKDRETEKDRDVQMEERMPLMNVGTGTDFSSFRQVRRSKNKSQHLKL